MGRSFGDYMNDTKPKMQAYAYGRGDGTYYYGVVELYAQTGNKIIGKRICKQTRLTPGEALADAIRLRKML